MMLTTNVVIATLTTSVVDNIRMPIAPLPTASWILETLIAPGSSSVCVVIRGGRIDQRVE